MTEGQGAGIYDALCGMSHPTLWNIREVQEIRSTGDLGIEFEWLSKARHVETLTSNLVTTLYRANMQLAGYFGWDVETVKAWSVSINEWLPGTVTSRE